MDYLKYFQYNSVVILSYFFLSLLVLCLKNITKGKIMKYFTSGRGSVFNPLTYIKMFTHVLGHADWNHFRLPIVFFREFFVRAALPFPHWNNF